MATIVAEQVQTVEVSEDNETATTTTTTTTNSDSKSKDGNESDDTDTDSETSSSGSSSDSDSSSDEEVDGLSSEQKRLMKQKIKEMQAKFAKHTEDQAAQVLKEIQSVVEPGLTTQEAQMALDVCGGDETHAKTRLVTDPSFQDAIKEMTARKYRVRKPKGPKVRSRGVTTAIEINSTDALEDHLQRARKQGSSSSKSGGKRLVLRDAMAMALKAGLIDEEGKEKELTHNNEENGSSSTTTTTNGISSKQKNKKSTTPSKAKAKQLKKTKSSRKKTIKLNSNDGDEDDLDDFEVQQNGKSKKKTPSTKSTPKKTKKTSPKKVKVPEGFQIDGRDEFVGKRTRRFFGSHEPTDGTITCWSPEDKEEGDEEVYRNVMDDGDEEDLSIEDAKLAIKHFETKDTVAHAVAPSKKRKVSSKVNMNDCLDTDQAKKLLDMGWSKARVKAFMHRKKNPNAYYYRFNDLGEQQATGAWTEAEHNHFLSLIKNGVDYRWGELSIKVPGRVGYQCSNYYRLLIEKGVLNDPNYELIEYKDEKTGKMKKKLKFTRPKVVVPEQLKITGDYAAASAQNPRSGGGGARKAKKPRLSIPKPKKKTKPKKKKPVKERKRVQRPKNWVNIMPGFRDPMTQDYCYDPAISIYGHVMSYDCWMQTLMSYGGYDDEEDAGPFKHRPNTCPFTNQPLNRRQLTKLTAENIDEYKDKIVNWDKRYEGTSSNSSGSK